MPEPVAEIVILTKAPVPGQVKTRLAAGIGPEAAADLHAALAEYTVQWALQAGAPVRVSLQGPPDGPFADRLRALGATISPQPAGTLGDRLANAWGGAARTLYLGTDCPTARVPWLREALDSEAPVCVGPSEDGGYWSICVAAASAAEWATRAAALFGGVPWSTAAVAELTAAACARAKLGLHWLPRCYDIDELADLQRLAIDPDCPGALQAPTSLALRGA